MIIGHTRIVSRLEQHLPPVTLLTGPVSVGKRTIAEHLARHHGVLKHELIRLDHITSDIVRDLQKHANFQSNGPFKLLIIRLDGAHELALNAMLKLLEEPPASTRFILLTSYPTLPTILSRAEVFRCGLLTDAQVAAVLQLTGMAPEHADRLASCGRGSVRAAHESEAQGQVKTTVLAAIKAVAYKDTELLTRTLSRKKPDGSPQWTDEYQALLVKWAFECASGRWVVFTAAESYGLDKQPGLARTLIGKFSAASSAPPRLAARAVLEDACLRR